MTPRQTTIAVLHHWWDNVEKAEKGEHYPRTGSSCAYCSEYLSRTCERCPLGAEVGNCTLNHNNPWMRTSDHQPESTWDMYLTLMNIAICQGILKLSDFDEQGLLIPVANND